MKPVFCQKRQRKIAICHITFYNNTSAPKLYDNCIPVLHMIDAGNVSRELLDEIIFTRELHEGEKSRLIDNGHSSRTGGLMRLINIQLEKSK